MKHFKIQTRKNQNRTEEVVLSASWGMVEIGPLTHKSAVKLAREINRRDK